VNALVTTTSSFDPTNLDQAISLSQRFAKSGLVPQALKGKPDDVLLVMMAGKELGFSTVQSFRSFYVLNGKLGMYADAMVGLCVGKPFCRYFRLVESTAKAATYETQREGSEPVRLSYTYEQAARAKLVSNATYSAHTEAMLRARCSAALARVVYPDCLAGLFEPFEIQEMVGAPAQLSVVRAEPATVAAPPAPEPSDADDAVFVAAQEEPYPEAYDQTTGEVVEEAPAELARFKIPWGKNKDTPVLQATVADLRYTIGALAKNIEDPSKEQYRDRNRELKAACEWALAHKGAA